MFTYSFDSLEQFVGTHLVVGGFDHVPEVRVQRAQHTSVVLQEGVEIYGDDMWRVYVSKVTCSRKKNSFYQIQLKLFDLPYNKEDLSGRFLLWL